MIAVQMSFIYVPRNVTIWQIKHAALSAVWPLVNMEIEKWKLLMQFHCGKG